MSGARTRCSEHVVTHLNPWFTTGSTETLALPPHMVYFEKIFLGHIPTNVEIHKNAGPVYGFKGCIQELQVNNREFFIIDEALRGKNIENCHVLGCTHHLCRNNGTCVREEISLPRAKKVSLEFTRKPIGHRTRPYKNEVQDMNTFPPSFPPDGSELSVTTGEEENPCSVTSPVPANVCNKLSRRLKPVYYLSTMGTGCTGAQGHVASGSLFLEAAYQ
ncbi:hypothetical protein CB1_001873002 [Camelus ferus]|nr:hypothetical protein CB1_001873002 [Camelus ferus]